MTEKSGTKLTLDWVEGTSFNFSADEVIDKVLGFPQDRFVPTEKGALGYMSGLKDGNITIWYDGSPGMGVHFTLTGDGCRHYENVIRNKPNPLFHMLKIIHDDEKVKLSRLDLAIDDFSGSFSIPTLARKVKNGEAISKFKKARRIEEMLIEDGSNNGTTLYFGSVKSDIIIRMYEKNFEMDVVKEVPNWNRVEIQLRDDRANAAVKEIFSGKTFGEVCFGILNNYIRFVDIPLEVRKKAKLEGKKVRKDRFPLNKKWQDFVGDVAKLSLSDDPKETSLEQKFDHLLRQASKAFVMLEQGDYMPTWWILEKMREKGSKSLKPEDEEIIVAYLKEQEERDRKYQEKKKSSENT